MTPSLLRSRLPLSTLNTCVPPDRRAVPIKKPNGVAAKLRVPVLLPSPKPTLLTNVQWTPSGLRQTSVPYSCDQSGPRSDSGYAIGALIPSAHVQSLRADSHSPEVAGESVVEVLADSAQWRDILAGAGLAGRNGARVATTRRSQLSVASTLHLAGGIGMDAHHLVGPVGADI